MLKHRGFRYTIVAIALHWAMAALLLFMIWLGWNMDENESRFQLHKSIGITLLLLTVVRIVWRWQNPPPPEPEMPALDARLSHLVHMAFYALMLGLPLAGWVLVSASKFHVPTVLFGTVSWPHLPFMGPFETKIGHTIVETVHSKGAWLLIGLLALHVAGAVKHEISDENGVLKRMIPGLFGQTAGPAAPAKGAAIAFGSAVALFAAIAAIPIVSANRTAPPSPAQTDTQGNWIVDYAASEIRFSGLHDGAAFTGTFRDWTADIAFDPDALDQSHVRVSLPSAGATTGKKLYDDSLVGAEWFNASAFARIQVTLGDIQRTSTGYSANASITLKDTDVTVPFNFDLTIDGDMAMMNGTTQLSRKALMLGQVSDPNNEWVADAVDVSVTVNAARK